MADSIEIKWNPLGLIPVIVQHDESGEVLMLNWMNPDALRKTQETGRAHFWDLAKQQVYIPNGERGVPLVEAIWIDCDGDALLLTVNPTAPVCDDDHESCFYTELPGVLHPHSDDDLPWED